MIKLSIPGEPIPQPRARHTNKGGFVRTYEAPKDHPIHAYKALIQFLAASEMHEKKLKPIDGEVTCHTFFYMPIPKSVKASENQPHIKRPDIDNLLKAVADALKGIAWVDDSQICYGSYKKLYSHKPRVEVEISG